MRTPGSLPPPWLPAAYRRTCLEAHPDKALQGVTDPAEKTRVEDAFKRIQARGGTCHRACRGWARP